MKEKNVNIFFGQNVVRFLFCSVCLSGRLSPRLILDTTSLKLRYNIPNVAIKNIFSFFVTNALFIELITLFRFYFRFLDNFEVDKLERLSCFFHSRLTLLDLKMLKNIESKMFRLGVTITKKWKLNWIKICLKNWIDLIIFLMEICLWSS